MNFLKEPEEQKLTVRQSERNFENAITQDYIGEALRKNLEQANVLIVPSLGEKELADTLVFPSGTDELFQFLQERQSEELKVDIGIEEKDYKELSLHADWIILAEILVKDFVAPLLVALLAEYIIQRAGKRIDDTKVNSKITIVQDGIKRQIEIKYSGPASEYSDVMLKAITENSSTKALPHEKSKSLKRKKHHKKDK